MTNNNYDENIIEVCSYCFDDILDNYPYVVYQNKKYHKECYDLIRPELLEIDEELDGE
jgi:hypothetical protein